MNGDSHSAGAEAMNPHTFAEDDPLYQHLGRQPHPDNLYVSYGCMVANHYYALLDCDAESASSNDRIIRTTEEYIKTQSPDVVIIGWSTWEREEYLHNGIRYQLSGGGVGHDWPKEVQDYYRTWVINVNPIKKAEEWHDKIYDLHQTLVEKAIPHLFFNTYTTFSQTNPKDWGHSYIDPYSQQGTFYHWLKAQGHPTVNPTSYHFGPDAHRAWAEFLVKHLTNVLT